MFTLTVRGSTLESGIYRRQILTTKVDPRTVRVKYSDGLTSITRQN